MPSARPQQVCSSVHWLKPLMLLLASRVPQWGAYPPPPGGLDSSTTHLAHICGGRHPVQGQPAFRIPHSHHVSARPALPGCECRQHRPLQVRQAAHHLCGWQPNTMPSFELFASGKVLIRHSGNCQLMRTTAIAGLRSTNCLHSMWRGMVNASGTLALGVHCQTCTPPGPSCTHTRACLLAGK